MNLVFDGLTATGNFDFDLDRNDQERIRWYLEDFLDNPTAPAPTIAAQVERSMADLGRRLFEAIFRSAEARQLWARVSAVLPQVRVEITDNATTAEGLPWELIRDPRNNKALALGAHAFVRVSSPATAAAPESASRLRVLVAICRPAWADDVPFRSVSGLLAGFDEAAVQIDVLRPPTFDRLNEVLTAAASAGEPYHVVHFDGHGVYAESAARDRAKRGYLAFENPGSARNLRLVNGAALGELLARNRVRVLLMNACRSGYADSAYGSFAQEAVAAGVPGVVAMRFNVYVATAARFVQAVYGSLLAGNPLGAAVRAARADLAEHGQRTVGGTTREIQDWMVPVVHEPASSSLTVFRRSSDAGTGPTMRVTAVANAPAAPDIGFIGREETILRLDRAFDRRNVVLLHAYAGAGKTTTATEFAGWYQRTGGVPDRTPVLFHSFEGEQTFEGLLNAVGEAFELDGRRQTVVDLFAERTALWIWDNVETVTTDRVVLAEFLRDLAGGRAKILLTSRYPEEDWLGTIPARVQLPGMSLTESLGVADSLARRGGLAGADLDDWRPLLEYSAGNPLVLRALANQAVRERRTGPEQLEALIEAVRSGAADGEEAATLQRSLAYSLDYGFTAREQAMLAMLHLFEGNVAISAFGVIGKIAGDEGLEALAGVDARLAVPLMEWAEASGLLVSQDRELWFYHIHPAVSPALAALFQRHYGPAGGERAKKAVRAWVWAVASLGEISVQEIRDGRNRIARQVIQLEERNLRRALRLAQQHEMWEVVIHLLRALALHPRLATTGFREWTALLDLVRANFVDPATGGPVRGREKEWWIFTGWQADAALSDGDLQNAEHFERLRLASQRNTVAEIMAAGGLAIDDVREGEIGNLIGSLSSLGKILRERQRPECVNYYIEALDLSESIKSTAIRRIILTNLGHAFQHVSAIRNLTMAQEFYDAADLEAGSTDVDGRTNHAAVATQKLLEAGQAGDMQAVAAYAKEAIELYHDALDETAETDLIQKGLIHNGLGIAYSNAMFHLGADAILGDGEDLATAAVRHHHESAKISDACGYHFHAGLARTNAALALGMAHRDDQSRLYAEAAIASFRRVHPQPADRIDLAQRILAQLAARRSPQ